MKNCWYSILVMILLSACSPGKDDLVYFHVVKEDYTETIMVNGTIEAVNKTYLKSPTTFLSTITWVEEDGAQVKEGDTVCIFENRELSMRVESFREELQALKAQLDKTEADHQVSMAMLQADIENNNIQLAINSLDSVQKKFAPALQKRLISLEQQKAQIRRQKLERKFASQKTIGETEIRGLNSRIRQMENFIDRSKDELDEFIITTPKDGLILREELPTIYFMTGSGGGEIGGKVAPGVMSISKQNILQIPDLSKMQIIAELNENNYKKTKEGQRVMITVEAKGNLQTSGVIKRKMLTGRQQNRNSKVKMYEALIEIDSCHTQMTPGMNAACNIIITELKDTLVVPAVSVFNDEDEKYVYVREGKKFRKTPIETGYANGSYCIISSGLSQETYIALERPPKGKIIKDRNNALKMETFPADTMGKDTSFSDTLLLTHRINGSDYE